MALPAIDQPTRLGLLQGADPDLLFLFNSHGINEDLQVATLQTHDSMAMFAKIDDTEAGVRKLLADEWGIKAADSLASRKKVSAYLTAWDDAKEQVKHINQKRADARVAGIPVEIASTEHTLMQKAVEADLPKKRKLTKPEIPAKMMVEEKLRQIEAKEPKAPDLEEILSEEKATSVDMLQADIRSDCIMRVRTTKKLKGTKPRNAEELRAKHKLEGLAWLFARARQPRTWLQDLTAETFVLFSEYILGENVAGLTSRSAKGVVAYPSWNLILSFETALRRAAADMVKEDKTLSDCLEEVCKLDSEVRELHLVTPFRLDAERGQTVTSTTGGGKGASSANGQAPARAWSNAPTSNAGKGRGKTQDNKKICYAYNNKNERCNGNCNMLHICTFCQDREDRHPFYNCPSKVKGKGKGKGKRASKRDRSRSIERYDTQAGLEEDDGWGDQRRGRSSGRFRRGRRSPSRSLESMRSDGSDSSCLAEPRRAQFGTRVGGRKR